MASVNNKVILVGNPAATRKCATYPTATPWRTTASPPRKPGKTKWHAPGKPNGNNIVMYRRLAEIAGEYLKKGSSVYIEGRLQTRKWQDKQGNDRYTTRNRRRPNAMLGGRNSGGGGGGGYEGGSHDGGGWVVAVIWAAAAAIAAATTAPARRLRRQPTAAHARRHPPPPRRQEPPAANFDDMDDDIPFWSIFELVKAIKSPKCSLLWALHFL